MAPYIMDASLAKLRPQALAVMVASYLPSLPLGFIADELGFDPKVGVLHALRRATSGGI